ncbi:hypothetical protein [Methanogenium sp. MK-MG]|uniref:hypothetical protein n=1 Tax=Methanogenium sp. MK-MG TaxID=2599926 RepID=UPI0013EA277F|nr:hypothetical protein [Methanogenium sp. MK-MG]
MGETVHLSGKGGGYDDMYLFLTGPNLAPGGVRLDSITSPVVSGNAASFTRVPVRSGAWEYEWDTGRTGGTLDTGTYLVWVLPQPLDRYDLGDTSYATKSVLLTKPVLTAEISGTAESGGTEETAEETTPLSGEGSFGDEITLNNTSDEPGVTQNVSEDTTPLPTTAGSFPYPCLCAAGIVGFFCFVYAGVDKK